MTSTSEPKVWIHIGLPKTGTKTLQRFLFESHPDVWCMGRHQVKGQRWAKGRAGKLWARLKLRLTQRRNRIEHLRRICEREFENQTPAERVDLGQESLHAVSRLTAEGNRRLISQRGLPLPDYGYPI